MNEIGFRQWLTQSGVIGKVQSDCISRIKRIERELNQCDIDEQYRIDRCNHILSAFSHMGLNDVLSKYPNANFPVGKYYMSTYRRAINQYIAFIESTAQE